MAPDAQGTNTLSLTLDRPGWVAVPHLLRPRELVAGVCSRAAGSGLPVVVPQ